MIYTRGWQTTAWGPDLACCLFLNGSRAKSDFYIFEQCIVYGCFCALQAEVSSCDRSLQILKYYLAPCRRRLLAPDIDAPCWDVTIWLALANEVWAEVMFCFCLEALRASAWFTMLPSHFTRLNVPDKSYSVSLGSRVKRMRVRAATDHNGHIQEIRSRWDCKAIVLQLKKKEVDEIWGMFFTAA